MDTNKIIPYIDLPEKKRKGAILGAAFLWFFNLFFTFAMPIVYPNIMEYYDMMPIYAIFLAIASLAGCLIVPIGGKLGDKFGRKKVFVTVASVRIILFLVCISPICANPDRGTLFCVVFLVSTFIGSITGAYPQTILTDVTANELRVKWFGIFGNIEGVAFLSGLFLGGFITDLPTKLFGKEWPFGIFIFITPILLTALILLAINYENKPSENPKPIDIKGSIILTFALCAMLAWCSLGDKLFPRTSAAGIGILLAGIALCVFFLLFEKRQDSPIIDTKLITRNRNVGVSFWVHMLVAPFMTLCATTLSVFGQTSLHLSATVAGTLAIPKNAILCILPTFIGAWIAKDQSRRYRTIFCACGIFTAIGSTVTSFFNINTPIIAIYLTMIIFGFATSCQAVCIHPYVQLFVKPEEAGSASSMVQFSNSFGVVIFNAIYSIIYNAKYDAAMLPNASITVEEAVASTFSTMSVVTIFSGIAMFLVAFFMIKVPKKAEA